ncbi:MAG: cation:proton antiporter [Blautia sp.]|nr:cation:proton antiporter [Blautia sp.]MDY5031285.1 cation:proton antiporter [Blautia sp.]
MEYSILRDLAIIVIAAKFCGLFARKVKVPQVAGEIIAGLLIGPSVLGLVQQSDFLTQMAEIGVILLMFSAGLQNKLSDLIETGPKAFVIACAGVFVPLLLGTGLHMAFYGASPLGSEAFYRSVFIGVIMTATSVSITVQTLRELGRLQGECGTTIMSAAIIDDIIGIIVLTVVIGFKNPDANPGKVVLNTILFFVFAIVVGMIIYRIFKKVDARYPHTRRIPIMGLGLCLTMAYIAESVFGIADITGAFVAGVILCNISDSAYIERKMDIGSYMFFGPVFFASIGLKTTIDHISGELILFTVAFVIVALLGKVVGCGLAAKACGFSREDSVRIGLGMMTRGEVALIVSQKGLNTGLMDATMFTSVIILIIVSSVLTPVLLKLAYAKEAKA